MKKIITLLTAFSFISTPLLRADQPPGPHEISPSTTYADEEEEELLPPGKVVGRAANSSMSEAKKARIRNWSIAAGVVAIGIATLVLVAKNHK